MGGALSQATNERAPMAQGVISDSVIGPLAAGTRLPSKRSAQKGIKRKNVKHMEIKLDYIVLHTQN